MGYAYIALGITGLLCTAIWAVYDLRARAGDEEAAPSEGALDQSVSVYAAVTAARTASAAVSPARRTAAVTAELAPARKTAPTCELTGDLTEKL